MSSLFQLLAALVFLSFTASVSAQTTSNIDFGDDSGDWAHDGECDDPRFAGIGVASILLDEDLRRDASDCRDLFNEGRIHLAVAASASVNSDGIDFGDDSSTWTFDGECDDPRFEGDGMASVLLDEDAYSDATDCQSLVQQGRITLRGDSGGGKQAYRLEAGDETLSSGEYRDGFSFEARSGQEAVVDLRSDDFDPYLIVILPSGDQLDNDDFEGDTSRSLISLVAEESGTYDVIVTSYQEGETGGYSLQMDVGDAVQGTGHREESGTLARGDRELEDGEFLDMYEFTGRAGQRVALELTSNDFDTYLILSDPNGESQANDDARDTTDSMIVATLTESGTHQVGVTSYEGGETGEYRLTIDQDSADGESLENRDVHTLALGQTTVGELSSGDLVLESGGEYQDTYVFDGRAGQSVNVDMSSNDFDTYVALITPSGDFIENDDFDGSTSRSVVELNLSETGRYRVMATSYAADETGEYRLTVNTGTGTSSSNAGTFAGGGTSGGRTYGIFAGISDYPGTDSDLNWTAEDAIRVRDALIRGGGMRPEDAITLTDSDATVANLESALEEVASRAGPDDTFVFFYSGHGSRLERAGPEMSDPDALDETIVLYDAQIRDDEMREMFDQIQAGTTLFLLDSCFSGGFAKDMISVPGRMGMFSSEEDVTSQVAVKFRAGGYLSYFLDEAIGDRLADEDRDGDVTAIELSEYVHLRFRNDVKSSPGDFVRTSGPQSGYQHLVVDRGSVGPYEVLFSQSR
ncbi:MAG: pre-peptidase C-terminal domain-containing protein [Candidatus Rariloculaceae bacterium]